MRRSRKLSGLTTKYAIQKFLDSRRAKNCDDETVYWYKVRLETFADEMPQMVNFIRTDQIREFFVDCIEEGLSSNTIHGRYRALRAFFNFLYKEKHILSNPMEGIDAPRVETVVIKTFTPEQLKLFFSVIDRTTFVGLRDMALLYLLYDTGVRISEAVGVKTTWVFPKHLYVMGKGKKERLVPLGNKSWAYLKQYMEELGQSEYLFVNEYNTKLSRRSVDDRIKKYGKIAGITDIRLSAHTFRHTFAVNYLRNGGNERSLQEILGHTSYEMVKRYTRLVDDDIKAMHKKASPGDKLKL